MARAVAGITGSDFGRPAHLAEAIQCVFDERLSRWRKARPVILYRARVSKLLRNLAVLPRGAAALLRNAAELMRNVAELPRDAAGLLRNLAELPRNVAGLLRGAAGLC